MGDRMSPGGSAVTPTASMRLALSRHPAASSVHFHSELDEAPACPSKRRCGPSLRSRLQSGLWCRQSSEHDDKALMAAHTEASRAAIRGYMLYKLRKMKIPLSLALLSNVLAIAALRSGPELFQVWEVISPCVQNILLRAYLTSFLGFFTGFSLNNAFQRFSRGLDHVQQLSVHLRTGTDLVLSLLAGSGEPGTPNIDRNAEEVVSWTKVYFIQACRGLHSVTLRTKRSKLDRAMEQWETFLSEQVVLSAACVSAVAAHSDVFVSTLQMELLWWRWLAPVLGSCPVDVQPSRKSFDAARSSFHAAHLLASGMTFPITMRLLEVIMYLFCLCHPWLTVQAFGAWSFLPTLFVTWLFFSAHRMSIDLWEPYGVDNPGVVDVELFGRAQTLCEQLDNMLSLWAGGHYAPLDLTGGAHFRLTRSPFDGTAGSPLRV